MTSPVRHSVCRVAAVQCQPQTALPASAKEPIASSTPSIALAGVGKATRFTIRSARRNPNRLRKMGCWIVLSSFSPAAPLEICEPSMGPASVAVPTRRAPILPVIVTRLRGLISAQMLVQLSRPQRQSLYRLTPLSVPLSFAAALAHLAALIQSAQIQIRHQLQPHTHSQSTNLDRLYCRLSIPLVRPTI